LSDAPLTLEEAHGLSVSPDLCRFLAPREVAEHGVLPIGLDGDVLTVAADPTASARVDLVIRLDHGLRQVIVRRAARGVVEWLLARHFRPFWEDRGWDFPGLAPEPGAGDRAGEPSREATNPLPAPSRPEPVAPADPGTLESTSGPSADAEEPPEGRKPTAGGDHPVVLVVEVDPDRRQAILALLTPAGYEVRFAGSLEQVDREVRLSPPALVTVRRDGPVPPAEVIPIVRSTRGATELRIVSDPVQAVLGGDAGDDRFPRFLFDLTRFFVALTATAGGGRTDVTEARARFAERAARRMGVAAADVEAARLAALLGDLDGHLARLRGDEAAAASRSSESVIVPLLDPVRTPYPIGEVLDARDERFDGSGPRGLRGDEIPVGARVLAAVDAFLKLREDGVDGGQIEGRLREAAGITLDPGAVEAVLRADRAERLVDRLGREEARERVLLVEPDPAAASLLEMRLANAGFDVDIHRDGPAALEAALESPPVLVLSEVSVPGLDGFTLLLRLRNAEVTEDVPFVFVSERSDRGSTMRGLELGADDFLTKPVDLELLVAKAKGLVRKSRGRRPAAPATTSGISGDLSEMGLVDLLQVLAASGKTARVRLEGPGGEAGEMSLEAGRLVDARQGTTVGLDAFNALLTRTRGRFTVETAEPENRTIDAPLESLLLEACRLLDEASRADPCQA
jgi:DNA-binding response OmpR family regulator